MDPKGFAFNPKFKTFPSKVCVCVFFFRCVSSLFLGGFRQIVDAPFLLPIRACVRVCFMFKVDDADHADRSCDCGPSQDPAFVLVDIESMSVSVCSIIPCRKKESCFVWFSRGNSFSQDHT